MVMDFGTAAAVADSIFFNISLFFSIKKCQHNENYREPIIEDEENTETGLFNLATQFEPVQNKTVWQSFFGLFSPYEDSESEQHIPEQTIDTTSPYICNTVILATQQESVYAEILVQWLVVFVLLFIILIGSVCVLFFTWKKQVKSRIKKPKSKINPGEPITMPLKVEEIHASCSDITENSDDVNSTVNEEIISKPVVTPGPVQLTSGKFHIHTDLFKNVKIDVFLEQTIDRFLSELDKKLGIGLSMCDGISNTLSASSSSNGISMTGLALTTPRINRRSIACTTRPRARQNVTSLPLGIGQHGDASSLQSSPWYEVEAINNRMKWSNQNYTTKRPDLHDITEPRLRNVLQSHQSSCPIKSEQLATATFMVNYILLLLEKELGTMVSDDGFRLVNFKPFGSMRKGTKISKASHFDVLMLMNSSKIVLDKAYHHNVTDDIPPGSVLITAREIKQNVRHKKLLKRAYIDENFHQVFSPSETMANASELIDRALTNIMTRWKKYMDRLPFTLGRSSAPELSLVFNTRVLHGLGLGVTEINICFQPAISLHQKKSLLLPKLYAVVPSHLRDMQNKPSIQVPGQGLRIFRQPENLDKDLLWDLSFCDLETRYLQDMADIIQDTGVQSSFLVCLQLLKTLFSNSNRTSLLNRGEIESYHLETILYFLLLESTPSHWTFENLPNRLSDAIHFLRSAVQCQWLPNFFVANPHLMKKCPFLEHIPFLNCSRQVNLFSKMSSETKRKTLNFINSRLTETGISAALKDEYSQDMWEYEFFIFG
ncbi:uncharacterized protein LOC126818103 [Patella vulgata]|uniref:uncharacterized protein LOC126818103 n=1 Tax=Patella vulgata TaxID=6465 RepID=UPI0024A8BE1A|nr:uncharacterized protein LOC126818103 [Patella vulgata]